MDVQWPKHGSLAHIGVDKQDFNLFDFKNSIVYEEVEYEYYCSALKDRDSTKDVTSFLEKSGNLLDKSNSLGDKAILPTDEDRPRQLERKSKESHGVFNAQKTPSLGSPFPPPAIDDSSVGANLDISSTGNPSIFSKRINQEVHINAKNAPPRSHTGFQDLDSLQNLSLPDKGGSCTNDFAAKTVPILDHESSDFSQITDRSREPSPLVQIESPTGSIFRRTRDESPKAFKINE